MGDTKLDEFHKDNYSDPSVSTGSTDRVSKILKKKIIRSSKMQNLTSLHAGNNLHSIYIVIDIIRYLEII